MLQKIGVLHIEINKDFRSETVDALERNKGKILKAVEIIETYAGSRTGIPTITEAPVQETVDQVLNLRYRIEANILQKENLLKEKLQRIPWDDLDLSKIQRLTQRGLQVKLCIASKKEYEAFDFGTLIHQAVQTTANQVYFAVIGQADIPIPFESVKVPERTLTELLEAEESLQNENENIQEELAAYAGHLPKLKAEIINIENELAFALAQGSYQAHHQGVIMSLSGWFPEAMENDLITYLKTEKLTYAIERPRPGDDVPVKLQNSKYSKLFEPITKVFELPNYYEWDPTPLIAVFYPIMFAYCLGDAGYGLIFFLVSLLGWFSFLKNTRSLAFLGMILGLVTTVMGLIKSGSVFGIPTNSQDWELFQGLGKYVLIPDDRDFIFNAFNVALMIGVVQIFMGIFVSIYNKFTYEHWIKAISQIGKLFIVSGVIWIFLADMQEMAALQQFGYLRQILLVSGVVMVLFFHDMEQAMPVRAASGILPLFFIFTGILGDILSYVRLFALGVASSVLGLVVNQIGMQIMENSWWGAIIGVIFLLFGHTLNFCIAVLGSFVHPLRLTFVEFYNNAQFKGGGKEYRPFRKQPIEL
ncbi:V-type ATP synthase subunit I [Cecembia lonarensis]|nr:V-type ATPase 116kDa subunit family protein [Cecembia lonarensis]